MRECENAGMQECENAGMRECGKCVFTPGYIVRKAKNHLEMVQK